MITILPFQQPQTAAIAALITHIQQVEFGVPVTLADQPDLMDIQNFYFRGAGHFWCALNAQQAVVGTIALIDIGNGHGVIRKMFVRQDFRGKEHRIAARLLQTLQEWAISNGLQTLSLGTFDRLHAAIRFYEKNGFETILPEHLPEGFPRMAVDNLFMIKKLTEHQDGH